MKRFGKASEMGQILLMSQKTVTGLFGKQSYIYQNYVIKLSVTLNSQKTVQKVSHHIPNVSPN